MKQSRGIHSWLNWHVLGQEGRRACSSSILAAKGRCYIPEGQWLLFKVVCFGAGGEDGMFWQRPWRLRAAVVHGWRAHRQRLTAIATHPNEQAVATAGRGHVNGQDQEVVRCWSLAQAAAGMID